MFFHKVWNGSIARFLRMLISLLRFPPNQTQAMNGEPHIFGILGCVRGQSIGFLVWQFHFCYLNQTRPNQSFQFLFPDPTSDYKSNFLATFSHFLSQICVWEVNPQVFWYGNFIVVILTKPDPIIDYIHQFLAFFWPFLAIFGHFWQFFYVNSFPPNQTFILVLYNRSWVMLFFCLPFLLLPLTIFWLQMWPGWYFQKVVVFNL